MDFDARLRLAHMTANLDNISANLSDMTGKLDRIDKLIVDLRVGFAVGCAEVKAQADFISRRRQSRWW